MLKLQGFEYESEKMSAVSGCHHWSSNLTSHLKIKNDQHKKEGGEVQVPLAK